MNLFKKSSEGKKSIEIPAIDKSNFKVFEKTAYQTLEDLIEQHAGLSFEKQMIFGDVVGSNAWEFDTKKGKIYFGSLEFPVQIIGSLSMNDNSWMWGWANAQSGLP